MKILVLGATGMLGYSIFKNLSEYAHLDVRATVRSTKGLEQYYVGLEDKLIKSVDVLSMPVVEAVINDVAPNIVINCIGLIKQQSSAKKAINAIQINSLLPHQLAEVCDKYEAKLIHFSTDCVFDGRDGGYQEDDLPSASDLYGKSKHLGEVAYAPHLTLRTSIIGHELSSSLSLIDWFLSQEGEINGYSKAVFSGMPTCYIAKLLGEHLSDINSISGLYHLAVDSIDKRSLLENVAKIYQKKITINNQDSFVINRSLNGDKLNRTLGLRHLKWGDLIALMHQDYQQHYVK